MKSLLDRTALALFRTVPTRAAHHLLFLAQSRPEISDSSDVCYEFLAIMPRLAGGVWVHVHDIFFPHDYPAEWLMNRRMALNEQYCSRHFWHSVKRSLLSSRIIGSASIISTMLRSFGRTPR